MASTRVVLVSPATSEGPLRDALARTRAELAAAGFEVVVKQQATGANPRSALERATREAEAEAAIMITSLRRGADVWVTDRITRKTLVRRIDVSDQPAHEQPRALAIRAVELLRASLVETVALSPEHGPPVPVPADVAAFVTPSAPPFQGIGGQMSVGFVTGFDGIGPAAGPSIRLFAGLPNGLFGRLSLVGPVFGADVEGPLGSAAIRQETLTLDLGYAPHVAWYGFTPMVFAGAGFHHLAARGELQDEFVSQDDDVWAAALLAGAGMGYRLTEQFSVLLDAAVLFALPRPTVTMAGERLGTVGRPTLASTLGVAMRF